ncbi:MAG: DUF2271 domain-containing protein [Candidatus Latescibacteria bacterium]|nr:DUF2271 domain-containing protein [Candidatus Latescibacterota bacterium]
MKKRFTIIIASLLVLFSECSMLGSKSQVAAGKVTINYTLSRISGMGSNQYAIWIEDETGSYVRTLFVTDYMAQRQGWKVRQQSLINWVREANLNDMPQQDIDAMSSATPQAGTQTVGGDLTDAAGKTVKAGVYMYRIEACLLMENNVLWSGDIHVGGARQTSQPKVSYYPKTAKNLGKTLISDISIIYEPSP